MITFAELDENLNVKRSIVVSEANNADENGDQDENVGIAFCKKLYGEDTIWKQAIGKRGEAHFGEVYNEDLDVFMKPQPFPSWTIVDNFWEAPIEEPARTEEHIERGCFYYWDEEVYQENSSEGWILFEPLVVSITEEPNDVTVSVGSSAIIGIGVTTNKGSIDFDRINIDSVVPEKYVLVDSEAGIYDWFVESGLNVTFDGNSVSTGILTTSDYAGDYRILLFPSQGGTVGVTTSFTLTVNE